MKIALCHHYSLTFYGGGERFLIDVSKQLVKRGHEVTIHALPIGRRAIDIKDLTSSFEYKENFIHFISDADVAYFIYAPVVNYFFIGNCPRICAFHSFVFLNELQHSEIKKMKNSVFLRKFGILRFASRLFFGKIEQRLLKEFDAIHVINKNALNKFQKWKRTYYIPNWIDTSCFKSSEDRYEKFSVLFSGRKSKGFSEFMEVADNMQGKGIDFFAIGPDIENTNSVRSLGFKTNVEELVRVYSRVHLLLYTSKIDVFPLTLVEAAACKIPIISFPTEAVKGLELPISYARSKKEFTRRILSVYQMWQTRREKYDELADNMRLQAKKYDVNNVFPEFLNMLRKVANINAS